MAATLTTSKWATALGTADLDDDVLLRLASALATQDPGGRVDWITATLMPRMAHLAVTGQTDRMSRLAVDMTALLQMDHESGWPVPAPDVDFDGDAPDWTLS